MLTSTDITAENRLIYAQVMGKFDEFFEIRTNVIKERSSIGETSSKERRLKPTSRYSMDW